MWCYAVDKKGASEEWVVKQICEDLETIGMREDRIVIKDDQEPSIVDVAKNIADIEADRLEPAWTTLLSATPTATGR